MKLMKNVITRCALLLAIALVILVSSGCKSTPEYIYVQPECSPAPRLILPQIDSGVLYNNLTLVHKLPHSYTKDLIPDLPYDYDGDELYYKLVEREKLIIDMLLVNEAIIKSVCRG